MSQRRSIGDGVGRHWKELETPALLLDIHVARRNVHRMAVRSARMQTAVRPHFKAHKCIELARMQIQAGAVGLTVATVSEALALIDAGIEDVLIANQVVQPSQIEAAARAALAARVAVLIDDASNLTVLAQAARRAGSELGVMVEVNTGMERCGVRRHDQAEGIARLASELAGVRFSGVSAYEGHCTGISDPGIRGARTQMAIDAMAQFAESIRAQGIEVPILSAGGTSTYSLAGADPRVGEIQPGAYALMDLSRRRLLAEFDIALTVAGTAVSRHERRVVLDCGLKAVNSKQKMPALVGKLGDVVHVDEEHLRFDTRYDDLRIGDKVRVLPGYGPLTINLYDRFHVVSGDQVVDEWAVAARR